MKYIRSLRENWLIGLFALLSVIWFTTALTMQIAFVVIHHRLPVSGPEVFNWIFGLSP